MKTTSKKTFLLACGLLACTALLWPEQAFAQPSKPETEVKYLSGHGAEDTVEWDFFCTAGQNSGEWTKIQVPSCWEQQGFGGYTYGVVFYGKPTAPGITNEQGMYKYEFDVPAGWQGRQVRIVFDGVMTDAHVKINGTVAIKSHQGAFYRFKQDISGLLKYGEKNLLEVTVSKESANTSVNLAERRGDYWNFGGIFRPVFLESLPPVYMDRTAIDAKADGTLATDVHLGFAAAKPYRVRMQLTELNGKPVGKPFTADFVTGTDKVTVKGNVPDVKRWTAETPNLYNVKIDLMEGEKVLHTLTERTGFRTIEVRPSDGVYINGQRIVFRGVNRHTFWPETGRTVTKEQNYNDVRLIKEMNMNAVRSSHYPPDTEFIKACDELGLYLMDELGGWHGKYDTSTGRKLIAEMVQKDVNHPSIVFWANGNEGGWNTDNDGEFHKYDPQKRPVLHPQQFLSGIETMHYRSYGETQEYLRGDYIYMPTEFLHGLYDGGHGAGLWDYWEMMRKHPRCAGGFLWVFGDEGVVRTDQGGRIDNYGNFGADGIVGPHREKEGSFFAVKEIWSPVVITTGKNLPENFDGTFTVENRYDFINLKQCRFEWKLANFNKPGDKNAGHKIVEQGGMTGPDIAPHGEGSFRITTLPGNWKNADVLYVTARSPYGEELWTWDWTLDKPAVEKTNNGTASIDESDDRIVVKAGKSQYTFCKADGQLKEVVSNGKKTAFANGPRFFAARRANRTLDGDTWMEAPKGVDRTYDEIKYNSELRKINAKVQDGKAVIEANYFGAMIKNVWTIYGDGTARLDYEYGYDGVVELMGIVFDYPEEQVKSKRWLGKGPYRVWQNRLHGTTMDVWENNYNNPIPGESFEYPEFKGYFADWRWATFNTTEGSFTLTNNKPGSYLGAYTPIDGRDKILYTFPETDIAVWDVIPAVRNKVNTVDLNGPSAQPKHVSGVQSGSITLKFDAK